MKGLRLSLAVSLSIVGFLLAGTAAKADPLSITLDLPYQSGYEGQTLTFDAVITNNSSDTVYLNGDSSYVDPPLTLDDTGFWNNSPLSLDPGDSSLDIELFTVTIPIGTPVAFYTGYFQIYGGGPSDDNLMGTADFDINVLPEPSSYLLFGTGLAVLALTFRRRLIQSPAQH
jgi:hypothetical protein